MLLTEGFTLVYARLGRNVEGWFILLQMETPSAKDIHLRNGNQLKKKRKMARIRMCSLILNINVN